MNNIHMHRRNVAVPRDNVVIEVRLLDRAVLDADPLGQCETDAIDNAALGLSDHIIRLYRHTTIDGTPDIAQFDLSGPPVERDLDGAARAVEPHLLKSIKEVEQTIEQRVTKGGAARVVGPDLPYTRGAKKVLELAMAETRELDHSYVGSEHLLLGLLREGAGVAAEVLTDLGVTLEEARAETLRLLGTEMPSGPPRPRRAEILDRMRVLVNELLGVPGPDASRLRQLAMELSGLLDDLGRAQ